ncbi:hypothetical protein Patl1_37062 [Pistacia atlantica]|nr:hypothetical protein Patl1_37062 [Pistacia atlantica]
MTVRWPKRKWRRMCSLGLILRGGAFSALFAHLFHSRLNLPCLLLPFSSVEPFRVEDLCIDGLERVYLLDFLGPKGYAAQLSQRNICEVIGFDHRKSVLPHIKEDHPKKVTFYADLDKSSSTAVYEYFSSKLVEMKPVEGEVASLLNSEEQDRLKIVLKLLEISATGLISKGNSYISARQSAANKLLDKVFGVWLGRGFYGECLLFFPHYSGCKAVRADGSSNLSDEIGKQLSVKSAAAGLRPIGAVVYMQRNNLKMCLRSTDSTTDTSEIAKAYGGGGSASSSSFIIRMDEYNKWLSVNKP